MTPSPKACPKTLALPVFRSEWVLWLLLGLSLLSVAVMVERWIFYGGTKSRSRPFARIRQCLDKGGFRGRGQAAGQDRQPGNNVVLAGLRATPRGQKSVEDLLTGAMAREKSFYERRLSILATLASNSPYIGLFGRVLGNRARIQGICRRTWPPPARA